MQIGFNNDLDYRGKTFHIQTEDRGMKAGSIETQIFHSGAILDTAIIPYEKHLKGLSEDDAKAKVRDLMKAAHKNFYKKLHQGKYDEMVGLTPTDTSEAVDVEEFAPGQDRVPASALDVENNPDAFAIDDSELGEAVDLSKIREKLGGGGDSAAEDVGPATMMVTPSEIQEAMKADAEAAERAAAAPAPAPVPVAAAPTAIPSAPVIELPKTGATAWRGCAPPKEDLSILKMVEALAG